MARGAGVDSKCSQHSWHWFIWATTYMRRGEGGERGRTRQKLRREGCRDDILEPCARHGLYLFIRMCETFVFVRLLVGPPGLRADPPIQFLLHSTCCVPLLLHLYRRGRVWTPGPQDTHTKQSMCHLFLTILFFPHTEDLLIFSCQQKVICCIVIRPNSWVMEVHDGSAPKPPPSRAHAF